MKITMKSAAAIAALSLLAACGDDSSNPVTPSSPPPNVAGTYYNYGSLWLTQFNRTHDGYSGSFSCSGTITIAQATGSNALSGFATVGAPCPPISFDISGTVQSGGVLNLTMGGPKPDAGPCPAPPPTSYTGSISGNTLSARGTVKVTCPGALEGEYSFSQIVTAYKQN